MKVPEIYRVTIKRKSHRYYRPTKHVKVCTRRAMLATVAADRSREIVKIERAPVGDFVDVTAEFMGEES